MPRDISGNYTLPAGNPVVDNTIITSTWGNTTMNDIAAQLNNVLTRDGVVGPTQPLKGGDGTTTAPMWSFSTETNTGMYRKAAGDLAFTVGGTTILDLFNNKAQFNNSVGINVSPLVSLHVKGASEMFRLETTTARGSGNGYFAFFDPTGRKGYVGYGGVTDDFYITDEMNTTMYFQVNGSTRMQIAPTGNVGINVVPSVGLFEIRSDGAGIVLKSGIENGTVAHYALWNMNPNALQWYLSMNGANVECHNPRGGAHRYFISGIERWQISSAGCIGVPSVSAQSSPHSISIIAQVAPYIQWFYSGVADWRIRAESTASMAWDYGGGTTRMTLTSAGQLIVATNMVSPGIQNANSQSLEGASGYGVFNHANGTANATRYIYFGYNVSEIGSISQATTATVAFNTSSDMRLKEDIIDMPDSGLIVDALRPREFAFKVEPNTRLRGLIAQEVNEVLPEVVSYDPKKDWWGIDYGKLTPVLLREIQSLRARVAALEH